MKEILAKIKHFIQRIFCLFKLTISCKVSFGIKEESPEGEKDVEREHQIGGEKDETTTTN